MLAVPAQRLGHQFPLPRPFISTSHRSRPDPPAAARIARTTYDSSDLVVEYAMSAMRPGYPIETIMERKPAPDGLA